MKNSGLASTRAKGTPTRHHSLFVIRHIAGGGRETGRLDVSLEGDRVAEPKDGEVVVQSAGVVARVVCHRTNLKPLFPISLSKVMLPQQNPVNPTLGAVGSSQDLSATDKGATTEGR